LLEKLIDRFLLEEDNVELNYGRQLGALAGATIGSLGSLAASSIILGRKYKD